MTQHKLEWLKASIEIFFTSNAVQVRMVEIERSHWDACARHEPWGWSSAWTYRDSSGTRRAFLWCARGCASWRGQNWWTCSCTLGTRKPSCRRRRKPSGRLSCLRNFRLLCRSKLSNWNSSLFGISNLLSLLHSHRERRRLQMLWMTALRRVKLLYQKLHYNEPVSSDAPVDSTIKISSDQVTIAQ